MTDFADIDILDYGNEVKVGEKGKNMVQIRMPLWHLDSVKGKQGRVLIVGGSAQYHGAPIFNMLGAEAAGVDLITSFVPAVHVEQAKMHCLNSFVNSFKVANEISVGDTLNIHNASKNVDVLLLGSGLGKGIDVKKSVLSILSKTDIPVILDADALIPEILDIETENRRGWILTPHHGEFERVFQKKPSAKNLQEVSDRYGFIICLKGRIDLIAVPGQVRENRAGTPQMRVGGTGDVLAGIIAGYYSMGLDPFEACKTATFLWCKCGEYLVENYFPPTAHHMVEYYPEFVAKLLYQFDSRSGEDKDIVFSSAAYN